MVRSYSDDVRAENRLTPKQLEALNELSGWDFLPIGGAFTAPRTVESLVRRGLVKVSSRVQDGRMVHVVSLTPEGETVLYAYI